jgi:hypothetical protein
LCVPGIGEEETSEDPDRKTTVETVTNATKFVKCGGGMMARCLRYAAGPVIPQGAASPVWVAKEWIFEDLGQRLPTDEDFVVTIPPTGASTFFPTGSKARFTPVC